MCCAPPASVGWRLRSAFPLSVPTSSPFDALISASVLQSALDMKLPPEGRGKVARGPTPLPPAQLNSRPRFDESFGPLQVGGDAIQVGVIAAMRTSPDHYEVFCLLYYKVSESKIRQLPLLGCLPPSRLPPSACLTRESQPRYLKAQKRILSLQMVSVR